MDYVDQVGQQRWGSNHVWQFILDEEESEEGDSEEGSNEKEEQKKEQLSDEEDHSNSLELDNKYVMLGAEPGKKEFQYGIFWAKVFYKKPPS